MAGCGSSPFMSDTRTDGGDTGADGVEDAAWPPGLPLFVLERWRTPSFLRLHSCLMPRGFVFNLSLFDGSKLLGCVAGMGTELHLK